MRWEISKESLNPWLFFGAGRLDRTAGPTLKFSLKRICLNLDPGGQKKFKHTPGSIHASIPAAVCRLPKGLFAQFIPYEWLVPARVPVSDSAGISCVDWSQMCYVVAIWVHGIKSIFSVGVQSPESLS